MVKFNHLIAYLAPANSWSCVRYSASTTAIEQRTGRASGASVIMTVIPYGMAKSTITRGYVYIYLSIYTVHNNRRIAWSA